MDRESSLRAQTAAIREFEARGLPIDVRAKAGGKDPKNECGCTHIGDIVIQMPPMSQSLNMLGRLISTRSMSVGSAITSPGFFGIVPEKLQKIQDGYQSLRIASRVSALGWSEFVGRLQYVVEPYSVTKPFIRDLYDPLAPAMRALGGSKHREWKTRAEAWDIKVPDSLWESIRGMLAFVLAEPHVPALFWVLRSGGLRSTFRRPTTQHLCGGCIGPRSWGIARGIGQDMVGEVQAEPHRWRRDAYLDGRSAHMAF